MPFRYLPPKQSVRMAFNVVLDREPDPEGGADYTRKLASGELSRRGVAEALAHSEEFRRRVPIGNVLLSMHVSRSEFVAGLPRAARILDLGGTHQGLPDGALVHLGYPYPFERLVVVDLPVSERDEIYQGGSAGEAVQSELGPVEFAFHSMVDLGRYEDGSFDLVYSGQSIEHVSEVDGDAVGARGVPGARPGWLVLPRYAERPAVAPALGRAHEPRPQDRVRRGPTGRQARAGRLRRDRVQGPQPHARWRGVGGLRRGGGQRAPGRVRRRRGLPAAGGGGTEAAQPAVERVRARASW